MSNPIQLEQWQADVAATLAADSYFANIPVFIVRSLRIQSKIDNALAGATKTNGKTGLAVLVLMPVGDVDKENIPGPNLIGRITVRVQEIPSINMGDVGVGIPAEEAALYVLSLLHHRYFIGSLGAMTAAKDALTPSLEFDPKLTYDVQFNARLTLNQLSKVAIPTFAPSSGAHPQNVTISCATGGASIYYTSDGSLPTPTNGTLVAGVVAVTAAKTLRATAYLAGSVASDTNTAVYT